MVLFKEGVKNKFKESEWFHTWQAIILTALTQYIYIFLAKERKPIILQNLSKNLAVFRLNVSYFWGKKHEMPFMEWQT